MATSFDDLSRSSVGSDCFFSILKNTQGKHKFELADHARVTCAERSDGLLSVELVRELSEAMKPRNIPVTLMDPLLPHEPEQIQSREAA